METLGVTSLGVINYHGVRFFLIPQSVRWIDNFFFFLREKTMTGPGIIVWGLVDTQTDIVSKSPRRSLEVSIKKQNETNVNLYSIFSVRSKGYKDKKGRYFPTQS